MPLEHANGVATLANDGTYHKAHFVQSVKKRDEKTGKFVNGPRRRSSATGHSPRTR